ncbi:hypothetical protein F9288_02775 [Sphingomonas sp. CL5.1]|uniref:hypothetical protein n=1 Tax=Sphingomonas sp. CL5.1 TaxID=2653203 RepID=UPI001582B5AC|nr:hypothetical protein [Sphingomonas sp. CL5.1]QKR98686.1 hypothetical protein F9288_02775 [Sphingomonas sp. CL5.1]
MKNNETEHLLVKIGHILAVDTEYPPDGTLLYARLDHAYVSPAIFKHLGNQILYRWPDLDALGDALLELWEAQDSEPRWAEIEYLVENGRFTATYIYPDEIDPEDDDTFNRRDRIVRKYFGDKPIVYPPFPPDDNDGAPTYEL